MLATWCRITGVLPNRRGCVVPNNAVSALAKLLCDSVALIDDEILVENLEDLAALEISHGCLFLLAVL